VILAAIFWVVVLSLSLLPEKGVFAASLRLDCSSTFPCTTEVRQRARFWMQVFSRWNNHQVVLHDSTHPSRVYAIINSKRGCGRSGTPRVVEKKRKKIRHQLLLLARNKGSGSFARSTEGRRLLKLFHSPSRKELRVAASRIRCQQGNKDRFRQALQRFGRYQSMVSRAMRNAGLPDDLKYLPFVESAYNPSAYSRVGAAGLWQIMPRTARSLGLQVGVVVDERLDPEQATQAAAGFFRNSRDTLLLEAKRHKPDIKAREMMPFIVTSYNYGINGMRRALRKLGPDFGRVLKKYRSPHFQTAVKNFYASFLAARQVASHQQRYFPGVITARPLHYAAINLRRAASAKRLARVFSVPVASIRKLNPALTPTVWKNWQLVPAGYRLRLPSGIRGKKTKLRHLDRLPVEILGAIQYRVRRGDTACGIAARFAVSCRRLLARNRLNKHSLIRSGQKLFVPSRHQTALIVRKSRQLAGGGNTSYIVKRGESVCRIAQRLPLSCQQLLRINGLSVHSVVRPGQRLQIVASPSSPVVKHVSIAAVSRELIKPPDAELDIQIHVKHTGKRTRYRIRVQPEETLGHYADWLGLGSTHSLKTRNRLNRKHPLRVGQWLLLPVLQQQAIDRFEHQRAGFHALLLDEFRRNFQLQRIIRYRLARGDSAWHLSKRFQIPWWLLTRMNPQLLDQPLQVGRMIRIPVIQPRTSTS